MPASSVPTSARHRRAGALSRRAVALALGAATTALLLPVGASALPGHGPAGASAMAAGSGSSVMAAGSGSSTTMAPTAAMGSPTATGQAAAADRSVVLKQASLAAETEYLAARQRLQDLRRHAAVLAVRAAEAAAESAAWAQRIEDASPGSLTSTMAGLFGGDTELEQATDAIANEQHAADMAREADLAAQEAAKTVQATRRAWVRARIRAGRFETAEAAWDAANEAIRRSRFGRDYTVDDRDQESLEQRALRQWHSYLTSLARAEVVPPLAASLGDPQGLPDRLDPVLDLQGEAIPGVARLADGRERPVVLPAEAIEAVSETFSLVGASEVADRIGVEDARCGGLTAVAWDGTPVTVPADLTGQWQQLRGLDAAALQPGDLVFLGADATGVNSAGLVVGLDGADLLAAVPDTETGRVGVERVAQDEIYGARRPVAPAADDEPAPEISGCGTSTTAAVATDGLWTHPLGGAAYSMSAGYGTSGSLWSSGSHTGQDFAAPTDTPVLAMRAGVVSVEYPSWAGNLVRVDHGAGVETWYAHLSRVDVAEGQLVEAGQTIGAVGSEGNSTGPHLHLEVRLDGESIDPMVLLDPATAASSLASYDNGDAPATAMCAAVVSGPLLRCDAAVAYRLLDSAFQEQFGTPLCLTGGYRTLDQQVSLYAAKPTLAARPGTSNHGWGVAVDLCGGVESFGTPEHEWVAATAPLFGWHHPSWAAADGSRPEPWHFEFGTESA